MRATLLLASLALVASCEKVTPMDADRPNLSVAVDGRHPRSIDGTEARQLFLAGLERAYPGADIARVIRCTSSDGLRWECVGYVIAGRMLVEQVGIVVGTTESGITTRTAGQR